MLKNPYKYKGSLNIEEDLMVLVPRENDIQTISSGVEEGNFYTIMGPRQIGKTTFLKLAHKELKEKGHSPVFINFSTAPSSKLYSYTITMILDKISGMPQKKQTIPSDCGPDEFMHFFEDLLLTSKRQMVLLVDEIEGLLSSEEGDEKLVDFLNTWREIFETRDRVPQFKNCSLIIAANIDLEKFTANRSHSPYNVATPLILDDFSEFQCKSIMDKPFKALNTQITPEAEDMLIRDTGGHPQIFQHICREVVESARKENKIISLKDIIWIIKQIIFKKNTAVITLHGNITGEKKLKTLVTDILMGKKKDFNMFKEYAYSNSGAIKESDDGYCSIRNRIFEDYLWQIVEIENIVEGEGPICFIDEQNEENIMPYALKRLRIHGYNGIKDSGIADIPVDAQWIFLTGENSFGKTIILRSIVLALFGQQDGNTKLINLDACPEIKIGAEFLANGISCPNNLGGEFRQILNFAAYGPFRLELQSPRTQNLVEDRTSKTYSIFNSNGLALNIEYEMSKWFYRDKQRFENTRKIFLELIPSLADIKLEEDEDKVMYVEKEESESDNTYDQEASFQTLASGPRSIIALVGDMLIRLSKQQPKVSDPRELTGIVIIDELDLHLHPKWLRKLPGMLSNIFPKVQFIVSTHSVIPFLGAPDRSVFLRVNRNKKEGITIKRIKLDVQIKYLQSEAIMTSGIFGMDEDETFHTAIDQENLNKVRTEKNYHEITEKKRISEKLKKHEKARQKITNDFLRQLESEEK